MEIKAVPGERKDEVEGYVIEMLGHVEYRATRRQAYDVALAILEREVDRLRRQVAQLLGEEPPASEPPRHDTVA